MFSPEDIIARCALQNPTRNFGFGSLDAYVARKRETKAKYSKRDGRFCSALGRAARHSFNNSRHGLRYGAGLFDLRLCAFCSYLL